VSHLKPVRSLTDCLHDFAGHKITQICSLIFVCMLADFRQRWLVCLKGSWCNYRFRNARTVAADST